MSFFTNFSWNLKFKSKERCLRNNYNQLCMEDRKKTCFPAQWVLPAISFSFPAFSAAASSASSSAAQQRGSKDINWPICMFQWASERKWHLQSFLFLGRERIIALHCFKAYQVSSKAFQHPFLAGWLEKMLLGSLSLYTDVIFQIYEAFILTSRTAIDFRPLFSLLLL